MYLVFRHVGGSRDSGTGCALVGVSRYNFTNVYISVLCFVFMSNKQVPSFLFIITYFLRNVNVASQFARSSSPFPYTLYGYSAYWVAFRGNFLWVRVGVSFAHMIIKLQHKHIICSIHGINATQYNTISKDSLSLPHVLIHKCHDYDTLCTTFPHDFLQSSPSCFVTIVRIAIPSTL